MINHDQTAEHVQVLSATGGPFDLIGTELRLRGIEDSSGARRAIASRLNAGDFDMAASWLRCTVLEAKDLYRRMTHPGT